eukprot:1685820-Amphidinium_carterae.1
MVVRRHCRARCTASRLGTNAHKQVTHRGDHSLATVARQAFQRHLRPISNKDEPSCTPSQSTADAQHATEKMVKQAAHKVPINQEPVSFSHQASPQIEVVNQQSRLQTKPGTQHGAELAKGMRAEAKGTRLAHFL